MDAVTGQNISKTLETISESQQSIAQTLAHIHKDLVEIKSTIINGTNINASLAHEVREVALAIRKIQRRYDEQKKS